MPTFVQIEDFSADGYCSCGGELHEVRLLTNSDEEIYPQICRKCGYGLKKLGITQEEKEALLREINQDLNELSHT